MTGDLPEIKIKAALEATLNTLIGTPVADVSTDIAGVKTVADTINGFLSSYAFVSVLAAIKAQSDKLAGTDGDGTITFSGAGAETKIFKSTQTRSKIHDLMFDMNNIDCDTVVASIQVEIDDTTYREIDSYTWTLATDSKGFYIGSFVTNRRMRVVLTPSATQETFTVPYTCVLEAME